MTGGSYEIRLAGNSGQAASLIAELAAQGAQGAQGVQGAQAEGAGPTVVVDKASVASLTAVAQWLRTHLGSGIVVDLTLPRPTVTVDADLPAGALLVAWQDGRRERREGLSTQQIGYLMRTALATAGL